MRTLIICLVVSLCLNETAAKDAPRYPVSAIPDSLKQNAYAVIREDHMAFTIHTRSTATLRTHFVVTIFQEKGRHFAQHAIWYSGLLKINSFTAQVIDADGNVIRKLKNREFRDQSAYDGLFSDTRLRIADVAQARYPYTVEFEYEVAYNFLYDIPGSAFNQYEDVAVQNASYSLIFPPELKPRYRTHRIPEPPKEDRSGNMVSLLWEVANIMPPKSESYSDSREQIMAIQAAPTIFEFEGYVGSMETWDDYGKWIASLNEGRGVLPEASRQHAIALTENLSSPEEKMRALYTYLQSKTRYVSVQLGIGGYQPLEASAVDKNSYGDCKALSNYMLALLEAVGIKGHYVLIRAGEEAAKLKTDFPSSQFNHAIVAVPNGPDTVWLECTSQTNPFGYLGTHTGNRKALLITDDGAVIVNTTRYPATVNTQNTRSLVRLNADGSATARIHQTLAGLQYENGNLNFLVTGETDRQKRWLERNIPIPSFNLTDFSMHGVNESIPSADITAAVEIPRLASTSGKRIFLTPNLMNRITTIPQRTEERKTDIVRKFPYTDIDTITYDLPENIYPEFLPEDVEIRTRFGEYRATFHVEQGKLVYTRRVIMHDGRFPASSYREFIDFYSEIRNADNTKVVFMTKT